MKKILSKISLILIAVTALTLNSCKKEDATDDSQSAKDATAMENVVNATSNDADLAAGQANGIAGKTDGGIIFNQLCPGAVITDTSSTNKTIEINYNGTYDCGGVIVNGSVSVQLTSGTYWKDAGAVLTVTINNLQFTDVSTGGVYTLNGAYTITNENGGLLYNMFVNGNSQTIVRRHQTINSQPLTLTFANGAQRSWTFDRTRTFTLFNDGNTTLVNVALSTQEASGVAMSGTNRYGESFQNMLINPIQATNNSGCYWKPWTGTWQHIIGSRTTTVLFGTNVSGAQVGNESNCVSGEGYFITYTHNGRTLTKFVEYWQ